MKNLPELPRAWWQDWGESGSSEKGRLIERLERDGYRPISVNRAVIPIEQVEPGDECPEGWAKDPLRVSIYPDPDAMAGTKPDVLWLNAGRTGLMDVYVQGGRREDGPSPMRMIPVPAEDLRQLHAADDRARAIGIAHLLNGCVGPYYSVWSDFRGESRTDDELGRLADDVKAAVHRYLGRLRELSTDPGKS